MREHAAQLIVRHLPEIGDPRAQSGGGEREDPPLPLYEPAAAAQVLPAEPPLISVPAGMAA